MRYFQPFRLGVPMRPKTRRPSVRPGRQAFVDCAMLSYSLYRDHFPGDFWDHLYRGDFDVLLDFFPEPLSAAGAARPRREAAVARKGNTS